MGWPNDLGWKRVCSHTGSQFIHARRTPHLTVRHPPLQIVRIYRFTQNAVHFLRLVCVARITRVYDDVDGVSFVEYCTTQNFSTSLAGRSINSSEANVKVGQHFVGDDHVVVNVVGDHHRAT